MSFDDFEFNKDGTVKVCPLAGWDSFVPFGMMCGIRVHYADGPEKLLMQKFDQIPLIMTPAQARELAEVLVQVADKAERPASPDETQQ